MDLGFDLKEWEKVEPIEMGDFETLELGGHEVIIMDARKYTSEISGNTSLKVSVDIAKGDKQEGFFKKQYEASTDKDKKWSSGATRYLSLKTESLAYTKGFITALEKSNNGFKFDTSKGWEQLKGLKCVGVFGLEEYQDSEGKTKTATKLVQFRSLDKLKDVQIPKVKLLNGELIDYEEYKNRPSLTQRANELFGNTNVSDEELPFEI